MKRDRERIEAAVEEDAGGSGASTGKAKMLVDQDAGADELFAVLGYKVRSSDMADVAEKLEQLEMAMGNTTMEEGPYDNVHYNPSDLSGWVDSMLSELSNSNMISDQVGVLGECSSDFIRFSNDDDLRAIPGGAILSNNNKRTKPTPGSEFPEKGSFSGPAAEAEGPMVLVDSQESGVRLVHT
ncbi:hypothetical protein OROMI_012662 [Orobanche minor]